MNWGMYYDCDLSELNEWVTRNKCDIRFAFIIALGQAKRPPVRNGAPDRKDQLKRLSDAIESMDEYTKLALAREMASLDLLPDNDENPAHYDATFVDIINEMCDSSFKMSKTPVPRQIIERDGPLAFTHSLIKDFESMTETNAVPSNTAFVKLVQIGLDVLDYPSKDPRRLIDDARAMDG